MKIFSRDLDDQPQGDTQSQVESFVKMVKEYENDVHKAFRFAQNPDRDVEWALLQVGCSLTNLTMVPVHLVTDKRSWFKRYGRTIKSSDDVEYYFFLRANDYMRYL